MYFEKGCVCYTGHRYEITEISRSDLCNHTNAI